MNKYTVMHGSPQGCIQWHIEADGIYYRDGNAVVYRENHEGVSGYVSDPLCRRHQPVAIVPLSGEWCVIEAESSRPILESEVE